MEPLTVRAGRGRLPATTHGDEEGEEWRRPGAAWEPSPGIPGTSTSHRIAGHFWPGRAPNGLTGSTVQGAGLGETEGGPLNRKEGALTRGFGASPQPLVQDFPEFKQNIP